MLIIAAVRVSYRGWENWNFLPCNTQVLPPPPPQTLLTSVMYFVLLSHPKGIMSRALPSQKKIIILYETLAVYVSIDTRADVCRVHAGITIHNFKSRRMCVYDI